MYTVHTIQGESILSVRTVKVFQISQSMYVPNINALHFFVIYVIYIYIFISLFVHISLSIYIIDIFILISNLQI